MNIPVIRGVIDRRILINYHVDPSVLVRVLPHPFRPQVVHGAALAGICLIRLKQVRPTYLPSWLGISSENAAHRFAVEWDDTNGVGSGVYVNRRDTSSRLNALAGGRLFPGLHHHARFDVAETAETLEIAVRSDDGAMRLSVRGRRAARLPASSIFASLAEASALFEAGSLGYSATADPTRFQGLELRCTDWRVEPLEISEVHSSVFDDAALFPAGSIEFDSALLMRGIQHEWHGKPDFCGAANDRNNCLLEPAAR